MKNVMSQWHEQTRKEQKPFGSKGSVAKNREDPASIVVLQNHMLYDSNERKCTEQHARQYTCNVGRNAPARPYGEEI